MRLLILGLLFLMSGSSFAQVAEMNPLKPGRIGISIYFNDTLINIGSNKLKILINEQTDEIIIRLDPTTLHSGIDSLDRKMQSGLMQEVIFRGTIDLDKIWETNDRGRAFEVEGDLTLNDVTEIVSFHGTIRESQQGMDINGLLYLHFDPELAVFGLDEKLPHFADHACVEILQPIKISNNRH